MIKFNTFGNNLFIFPLLAIFLFPSTDPVQPKEDDKSIVKSEQLDYRVDTLLTNLKIPWGLAFLPNGDLLFTERGGELRLAQNGQLHPDPIKGVPEVRAKGQGGLLDITLHPDYEKNGWLYLTFSKPYEGGSTGTTALIRARLKDHSLVDLEEIWEGKPAVKEGHHYGSRVIFDGKGYLYVSMGDRGGGEVAQELNNHRGKVMRLHDDGRVPADNPFVNMQGALPEIYSYGHRNPQGMVIHSETGQIWESEHGPKGGDEINLIQPGRNYGWPTITYGINYNGTIITQNKKWAGMEQPVLYFIPSIGPSGLAFVNSDRYRNWKGDLLAGSLSFRYLERLDVEGDRILHKEKLLENIGRVRDVIIGPDGYIYVAVEGPGMIVRIMPVEES